MTATVIEERIVTSTNKPESAHIVMDPDRERDDPHAYLMEARFEGFPVTALCGFTWIPNKQATGLPVCQECFDIFQNDPNGFGDRDDLPDE